MLLVVAPRLRTASPAEADGSLPREGPVPLVGHKSGSCTARRRTVRSHDEVSMTTTIVLAMVVGTSIVFAQKARRNTVVQTGRQAGMSMPRGK